MEAHGLPQMLTCGQIINGRRQISPPRPGFCPEREQMFRISYFSAYFCSKNTVFKGVFMRKKTILRDPWRPVGFRENPWRPVGVRKCSAVAVKSLLRDPGSVRGGRFKVGNFAILSYFCTENYVLQEDFGGGLLVFDHYITALGLIFKIQKTLYRQVQG